MLNPIERFRPILVACLLLGSTTACNSAQPPTTTLSLQVEPTGNSGTYLASGTTNLPERSRLVIAAIRYVQTVSNSTVLRPETANYTILSREIAEVTQGKWQATLKLWEVAPNGSYQEAWQRQQTALNVPFKPTGQVVFVATFEPGNQLPTVSQQVSRNSFQPPLLRVTASGEAYLQVNQALAVNLPTGRTTSPPISSRDVNDGWGDRSVLKPQPNSKTKITAPPKEPQMDAPLPKAAFLR